MRSEKQVEAIVEKFLRLIIVIELIIEQMECPRDTGAAQGLDDRATQDEAQCGHSRGRARSPSKPAPRVTKSYR